MIYGLSRRIAFYFVRKGIVPQEEADVYRFGIETIICALADIAIAAVVGIIYRKLFYAMWFFLVFAALRRITDGYHAKTFIKCKIMMFIMMLLSMNIGPLARFGYIFLIGGLMVLMLIKVNDIECDKALFTILFISIEVILYFCERELALLTLMAFLVVMFAAYINCVKKVKK